MSKIDYNMIKWDEVFFYDENSPSGLRWLINARKFGYGDIAGSQGWNDKKCTKPKCWDVRYNKRSYKVHRIIWILFNGSIDNNLVINHIDNNPHNNNISNLELVSNSDNMRKCLVHNNSAIVQVNNSSGINGVGVSRVNGKIRGYTASISSNEDAPLYYFPVSKYGDSLALELARITRNFMIKELEQKGTYYGNKILDV